MGVSGQHHALATWPPGRRAGTHCARGCVGPRAGLDVYRISPTPRIWFLDHPACSVSLYLLHCPSLVLFTVYCDDLMTHCRSRDGTCILKNSDDNMLQIFDLPPDLHCQESWQKGRMLPELQPALCVIEGGLVYDYCWYPLMSSWNPLSCW